MPYTEITITHPEAERESYALCDKRECQKSFCRMFGLVSLDSLPVTRDKETVSSERIFEDSSTYHANCFTCGNTTWCGADCPDHQGGENG